MPPDLIFLILYDCANATVTAASDTASREEVRHMYPDPPTDAQSLDIQQQALLREQQRKMRLMKRGEEHGQWADTHTHFSSTQLCSSTHCSVFRYRLFGAATEPLSFCEWSPHFKCAFSSWQASQAHLAWFAPLKGMCLIGTCLCLFLLSEEQTWTLHPQRLHIAIWDCFYW